MQPACYMYSCLGKLHCRSAWSINQCPPSWNRHTYSCYAKLLIALGMFCRPAVWQLSLGTTNSIINFLLIKEAAAYSTFSCNDGVSPIYISLSPVICMVVHGHRTYCDPHHTQCTFLLFPWILVQDVHDRVLATGQFLKAFYKRQEEERIFRTQKKELVKLTQELDSEIILHSNPSKKRLKGTQATEEKHNYIRY